MSPRSPGAAAQSVSSTSACLPNIPAGRGALQTKHAHPECTFVCAPAVVGNHHCETAVNSKVQAWLSLP